jgi:hypothetical protein
VLLLEFGVDVELEAGGGGENLALEFGVMLE